MKQKLTAFLIITAVLSPVLAFSQTTNSVSARAYILMDAKSKNVIASENANLSWTPASLTKLVTALVVLDTKPKLSKTVAMAKVDQTIGECSHGGVCIKSATGVKFTVDGLFHATVIKSANNAANALARSTGLSPKQFATKMNAKAKALGATHSRFYEPTGMSPSNKITAADYAKIIAAAFADPYLGTFYQANSYDLVSTNNSKYNQTIKSSNPLLTSSNPDLIGAKTGYLPQSKYNLASVVKYQNGQELIIIVLGEPHMYMAYADTELLASIGSRSQDLALAGQ